MHFEFFDVIHYEVRVRSIPRGITPHANPCGLHPNAASADNIGIGVVANEQNFVRLDTRNIEQPNRLHEHPGCWLVDPEQF